MLVGPSIAIKQSLFSEEGGGGPLICPDMVLGGAGQFPYCARTDRGVFRLAGAPSKFAGKTRSCLPASSKIVCSFARSTDISTACPPCTVIVFGGSFRAAGSFTENPASFVAP